MRPRRSSFRHRTGCSTVAIALGFLCVLPATHPGSAVAVEWQEDVKISSFPMWSLTGPAIATGPDSKVHIVWSEQIGEDLGDQVFYRSGHGDDWDPVVQLSDSDGTSYPAVAVDREGRVHVVWSDWASGMDGIFYRRFESGEWTPIERINDYNGRTADHPRLAADPDGTVHLVWQQGDFYPPPTFSNIYYSHWDGAVWSPQEPLTEGIDSAQEPAIAVAPNGDVHVLWQDNESGADQVYHRQRVAGVWSTAVVIGDEAEPVRHPDIAVSLTGGVHAVMVREFGNQDRVCYSKLGATGWQGLTQLAFDGSDGAHLATSRCGEGPADVHVVWREYMPEGNVIRYMNIHGIYFGQAESITSGQSDALQPVITVDAICNLDVAWLDNRESAFMQGVYSAQGIASAAGVEDLGPGAATSILCAPNPFTNQVAFQIPRGASGSLRIFDVAGRIVRSLPIGGGAGEIRWDGKTDAGDALGTGFYFYRLDGATGTGRLIRIR
ncbi:MAG: hypothetical protein ACE15D_02950 [Candidatus Eisenbacteria bacterium]